jgi:hypothetical protein
MKTQFIFLLVSILIFKNVASQEAGKKIQLTPKQSPFKTPQGHLIKFKTNGNIFYIKWKGQNGFKTVDYPFDLKGADAWLPCLIAENDNFLVIRAGCGNPCWVGIFLPLKTNSNYHIINEYMGYDLAKGYVAYFNDKEQLEVLNLKTAKTQAFQTEKCVSAFKGYCVDTLYFKNNSVYLQWNTQAGINSKKGKLVTKKLKS